MRKTLILAALAGAATGTTGVVAVSSAGESSATSRASAGSTATAGAAAKVRLDSRYPRGPRGPRGFRGDAATDVVRSLSINWRNGAFAGRDTAALELPGLGRLVAVCSAGETSLRLYPARGGVRTVATVTRFEDTKSVNSTPFSLKAEDPVPVADPLPPNGMISATLSVQPLGGDGGRGPAPATLIVSSEHKLNGETADENFCFVAAQAIVSR